MFARRRLAMCHDYNLPFGLWGMEQTEEQDNEMREVLKRFVLLCTSQHLADYVRRTSEEKQRARLCYCADYDYLGPVPEKPRYSPWEEQHAYVTFIALSPQKGLPLFLKLVEMFPDQQFLAVP